MEKDMKSSKVDDTTKNQNGLPDNLEKYDNKIHHQEKNQTLLVLHFNINHKVSFLFGILVGFFVLRHQVFTEPGRWTMIQILGFELDFFENCIVMRDKYGVIEDCRAFINCEMCQHVEAIHIITAGDMTQDLFIEKYENSGQPVLIKNAANEWPALEKGFEFFKNLYLNLSSPVLKNEVDECEFLSWDFDFKNILAAFKMPEKRWKMKRNYEPWYFGWANCDNEAGKILEKLYSWPEFLPEDSETGKPSWIFLGTPGFGAPFHVDRVTYPSWQAQIHGIKSWALKPPPECYYSCNGVMNITTEPGDILVVNTNWWQHSTSVHQDLSISITNEYDVNYL